MALLVKALICCCAIGPVLVSGRGFLHEHRHTANSSRFRAEIQDAIAEVQGCGGHVEQAELDAIRASILPMWLSLPKSSDGRIERPLLRHLVHRYFRHSYSFIIRGFEESRPLSNSDWNIEQLLSERVPGHLESMLTSRDAKASGFDLETALNMVAVIEKLVFDQDAALLDEAYGTAGYSTEDILEAYQLNEVLDSFMTQWTRGDLLPEWEAVLDFAHGQVRRLDFERQASARAGRGNGNALSRGYTWNDARHVVSNIVKSFGSFFNPVCEDLLREPLERMDTRHSGRIPLMDFYARKDNFAESVEHLRAAGALDETGRKPQVLLANYMAGTSNCFISTSHYMACCSNPCESIHGDIERAVGTPSAALERVLDLVGVLRAQVSWESAKSEVPPELAKQLGEIAALHSGQVPLHGRLFAQWLHYAFPRECPFPHQSGTVVAAGPDGKNTPLVTYEEKLALEDAYGTTEDAEDTEETKWMSQWSAEEELMTDSLKNKKAKFGRSGYVAVAGAILLLVLALAKSTAADKESSVPIGHLPMVATKAHLV